MNSETIHSEQVPIRLSDGTTTEATVFKCVDTEYSPVICLPALGVDARYYVILAEILSERGFSSAVVDLRGHGMSSVRPSSKTNFGYQELLEVDMTEIVEALRKDVFKSEKVILLGHSLGGQLSLLHASVSDAVSHVVAVAAGSNYRKNLPWLQGWGRWFGLQLLRGVVAGYGYLPKSVPFAGKESAGVITDLYGEGMTGDYRRIGGNIDYEASLAKLSQPALFISLDQDRFVPHKAMDAIADKVPPEQVTRVRLPPKAFRLEQGHHFKWAGRPSAIVDQFELWLKKEVEK